MVRGYYLGEVDSDQARQCFADGLALATRVGHRSMAREFSNNLGYTSFLTGEWDLGLSVLDAVLAEESLQTVGRIWVLSNELIIRISRGEDITAGLAELDQLASQVEDPHVSTAPHDTKANLAQSEGRLDDAQREWLQIGANWPSQAPASYYQAARPALWARDLDAVRRYNADIDATGVHGPVVEVRRTTMRAALAALEGRTRDAFALYTEAFAAWGSLKVMWEQALTALDMATVLDQSEPVVAAAIKTARETFIRLGAKPYLARLEMVAARDAPPVKAQRPVEESVAEPA
jgi:hypothetical protein